MATVAWLYEECVDVLTAAEAFSTTIEAINNIIASVPGWGTLYDIAGFDDLVGFVTSLGAIGSPAIESAYDINIQRDMACVMFCAITDNTNQLDVSLSQPIRADWIQANPLNVAVAGITLMMDFYTKTGWRFVAREYALNLNNPDADWTTLCTDCAGDDETLTVDITTSATVQTTFNTVAGVTYEISTLGDTALNSTATPNQTTDGVSFAETGSAWNSITQFGAGLTINGTLWPIVAYEQTHIYTQTITGDGQPVTVGFADSDYTDNSGTLRVRVRSI
jgi:hypothetical protein